MKARRLSGSASSDSAPVPYGKPTNDANPSYDACAQKTATDSVRGNVSGSQSADEADPFRLFAAGTSRLSRTESNNDNDGATLSHEEKNFLDYLVKQALRSVLENDAPLEPDMIPDKDKT